MGVAMHRRSNHANVRLPPPVLLGSRVSSLHVRVHMPRAQVPSSQLMWRAIRACRRGPGVDVTVLAETDRSCRGSVAMGRGCGRGMP